MKDRSIAFLAISFLVAVAFIGGLLLGAMITNRANEQIAALEEPGESEGLGIRSSRPDVSMALEAVQARAESALEDVMALNGALVLASYYGYESGEVTANGERYNPEGFTAAHRQLPFNTFIVAENMDNGRHAVIRINDRGPARRLHRRGIDVSLGVARELGMVERGLAVLRLRVIGTPGMIVAARPSDGD